VAQEITLEFVTTPVGHVPVVSDQNRPLLTSPVPVKVHVLGHGHRDFAYDSVEKEGAGWTARVDAATSDGTRIQVTDRWSVVDDTTVAVDREAVVQEVGQADGFRVEFGAETRFADENGEDESQYFIPGSLYNRNDTDHDGVEDYLHTFVQDYRDDRLGSLALLAYVPSAGLFAALARTTIPQYDTTVTGDQMLAREFVQQTDIGSLGLRPSPDSPNQTAFRASYPFAEEYTYCLNVNRDGWAAFAANEAGSTISIGYRLTVAPAVSLTDAIAQITQRQLTTLEAKPNDAGFSMEKSLEYRTLLSQAFYREWAATEDPKEPAGYMVHFSPRTGKTQGTLLEYGFTGAQTLLAYGGLRYGREHQVPLYVKRAVRVIDFFVEHCMMDNGYPQGIYDVASHEFTYWFTGILLPFQYSPDRETARSYLGHQVADALWPIVEELKTIDGNYMRTMCDAIAPILLTYAAELRAGVEHPAWLAAGIRFGDFLLNIQGEDGSFHRGYDTSGRELTSPQAWFGASDTERKSGTIFPAPVLVKLHELTGRSEYLEAARKAADFIADTYVESVEYLGGLNDTTHIKSVKIDAVGVMFAMRSLLAVHEATGEQKYLTAAAEAAKVLASWVYLWDVPLPEGTLLAEGGFRSTGWAGCDVLPSGSYLDCEFLEFIGDYVRIAELTSDEMLFRIAELVEHGMQYALSVPGNMYGYVMPGIQCEGIMTGYWMSEPDTTAFSGAVNKTKGDDNDTTNGLINAQAAFGMYELLDRYGTLDFSELRSRVLRGDPVSMTDSAVR
jgi:hypothetical protein